MSEEGWGGRGCKHCSAAVQKKKSQQCVRAASTAAACDRDRGGVRLISLNHFALTQNRNSVVKVVCVQCAVCTALNKQEEEESASQRLGQPASSAAPPACRLPHPPPSASPANASAAASLSNQASREVPQQVSLSYGLMQALLQRAVPSLAKYGCVAFDMDYTLARCIARTSSAASPFSRLLLAIFYECVQV